MQVGHFAPPSEPYNGTSLSVLDYPGGNLVPIQAAVLRAGPGSPFATLTTALLEHVVRVHIVLKALDLVQELASGTRAVAAILTEKRPHDE